MGRTPDEESLQFFLHNAYARQDRPEVRFPVEMRSRFGLVGEADLQRNDLLLECSTLTAQPRVSILSATPVIAPFAHLEGSTFALRFPGFHVSIDLVQALPDSKGSQNVSSNSEALLSTEPARFG